MSLKRYNGTAFTEVTSRKRWDGSAWVALTVGKRWNGTAWVDLWNDSQGGGSGDSSGDGWLTKDTVSSASSPHVHYSAQYSAEKSGNTLTVDLRFASWLNSSASRLGSGIKLTIFARINGGAWNSALIKENSAVWSGSSKHYASLSLTGIANSGSVTVDFYVTRSGSSYGGDAGKLGTVAKPKSYKFTMS